MDQYWRRRREQWRLHDPLCWDYVVGPAVQGLRHCERRTASRGLESAELLGSISRPGACLVRPKSVSAWLRAVGTCDRGHRVWVPQPHEGLSRRDSDGEGAGRLAFVSRRTIQIHR